MWTQATYLLQEALPYLHSRDPSPHYCWIRFWVPPPSVLIDFLLPPLKASVIYVNGQKGTEVARVLVGCSS